jgi:hypothetical protein
MLRKDLDLVSDALRIDKPGQAIHAAGYILCTYYRYSCSIYNRRQAIVEHPYGTLKRQWGLIIKTGLLRTKISSFSTTFFWGYWFGREKIRDCRKLLKTNEDLLTRKVIRQTAGIFKPIRN